MKLSIATFALALVAAGSAVAADMPAKAPPIRPACTSNWFQGGYIGVNGGIANYTANLTDFDGAVNSDGTLVSKDWGGTAGAQIGFNWTTCNTLFGIEIDGAWVGTKADNRLFPNSHTDPIGVNAKLDGLVTGRLRTGIVFDNLLLYVTGGFAAVHTKTHWFHNDLPTIRNAVFDDWRWGWTAGFGTEWAFGGNWSLKSEVLYVEILDHDNTFGPWFGLTDRVRFGQSDQIWVSRIGLNYKFGAPVRTY